MVQLQEGKKETKLAVRKSKTINVFVLLLCVLFIATLLTHIVPSGEFNRVEQNGREIVDAHSFKLVDQSPVQFLD
ncbi:C4-dicarboxylate ABC transporter permease, partial [Priestia sp. AB]|nr:C4-dicarboxylate ABC transporter permease [Priestia sp. AB]